MPSLGIVPGAERTTDESLIRSSPGRWVDKRATNECEVPPLDIGVQAIQLSPYRSGVAGPPHTRLLRSPAFQPCACPLALSGPGQAVASESSALNSGLLWRQFTPCVTWRTVSLHPAQASQRPCERPVSSHRTCWLHDTTQKSMPLRGKVAPVRYSHRHLQHLLCRFLRDSRAETPQGSLPACAAGEVAKTMGATRLRPITGRPSLFPTPIPASPSVGLTAFLPVLRQERYGLTTFHKVDKDG